MHTFTSSECYHDNIGSDSLTFRLIFPFLSIRDAPIRFVMPNYNFLLSKRSDLLNFLHLFKRTETSLTEIIVLNLTQKEGITRLPQSASKVEICGSEAFK